MKVDYVVGFAFDGVESVLLVLKDKPDFLKGKWNGVGGKVEPSEEPLAAMVREFQEETGIPTEPADWTQIAFMETPRSRVWFFRAADVNIHEAPDAVIDSGEALGAFWVDDLPHNVKENLRWLLPLALEAEQLAAPLRVELAVE
jgi:8-oxo-dGTP diphosphatase